MNCGAWRAKSNSHSECRNQANTPGERASELAEKYPGDEEVLSCANGLLQKLNLPAIPEKAPTSDPHAAGATLSFAQSPTVETVRRDLGPPRCRPKLLRLRRAFAATPARPQSLPKPQISTPPQRKVTPAPKKVATPFLQRPDLGTLLLRGLVAGGTVVMLLVGIWLWFDGPSQLAETTPPPAAAVQPAAAVAPPPPPEPELPVIKLASDTATGKVAFDDQPPAESAGGAMDAGENSCGRSHPEI